MSETSWTQRLFGGFAKTSERLTASLPGASSGSAKLDDATLDDVEDALIMSDLGPAAAARIRARLSEKRFGLEITIMVPAPINSTRLRKATEMEEPTAALICVVSAVSRDINSPVCERSKKAGDNAVRWRNTCSRRSVTMRSPSVVTR